MAAVAEPERLDWVSEQAALADTLSNAALVPDVAGTLQGALHTYHTHFKTLLVPKAPNEADKQRVTSLKVTLRGRERSISKELADETVALSAALKVNELDVLQLLTVAALERTITRGATPGSLRDAARVIFWRDRVAMARLLLLVVREVLDQKLPRDVHQTLADAVAALLCDRLVPTIALRLRTLFAPDIAPEDADGAALERRVLCDVLASLAYTFALDAQDGRELLHLLRDVTAADAAAHAASAAPSSSSLSASSGPPAAPSTVSSSPAPTSSAVSSTSHDAVILLVAALSALDTTHLTLDPHAPSQHTASRLHSAVSPVSESDVSVPVPAHATLLRFARALGIASETALEELARQPGLWHALCDAALTLRRHATREVRAQQLVVIADVALAFLDNRVVRVQRLRHAHHDAFEALLRALATLYEALPPRYATPWWTRSDDLNVAWFVRAAIDAVTPHTFEATAQLVRALSQDSESAAHAHAVLLENSDTALPFSWRFFLNALHNIATEMSAPSALAQLPEDPAMLARVLPPDEVPVLRAMTQLMTRVLAHCADARDALLRPHAANAAAESDSAHLAALDTLFALLRCPLPLSLKADLALCLAALARSPQYARVLWEYVEEAQLVPTLSPGTSTSGAGAPGVGGAASVARLPKEGARYELYEIEARTGDYAYTEALLTLFLALVRVLVPPQLGEGLRAPGIAPYVAFVVDDVLLALHTRVYADLAQQARLAALALGFVDALLAAYTPALAALDLAAPRAQLTIALDKDRTALVEAPRSPAYTLLTRLLESYEPGPASLFGALFAQLDAALLAAQRGDAAQLLTTSARRGTTLALERALHVLVVALRHEPWFLRANHASAAPASVWPLARVLLHAESRVLTLLRLLEAAPLWHDTRVPLLTLTVLRLLAQHDSEAHARLVAVLLAHGMQLRTCAALATLLRAPDDGGGGGVDDDADDETALLAALTRADDDADAGDDDTQTPRSALRDAETLAATPTTARRVAIVALLHESLAAPAPNLAHVLLGFDVARIPQSDLGALPHSAHVLHALLSLLQDTALVARCPPLALGIYRLVAALSAHAQCGEVVQRYLRRSDVDFLAQHVQRLAVLPQRATLRAEELTPLLECRAVLLHTLARALYDARDQRAYRERVLHALFAPVTSAHTPALDASAGVGASELLGGDEEHRLRVLTLLDVTDAVPRVDEMELLNEARAKDALSALSPKMRDRALATRRDTNYGDEVDLEALATLLEDPDSDEETRAHVAAILQHAVELNAHTAHVRAQCAVVAAWRAAVEVAQRVAGAMVDVSIGLDAWPHLALLESVLQRLHAPACAPALREELALCAASLVAALLDAHADTLRDIPVQQLLEALAQLIHALLRVDVTLAARAALGTALLRLLAVLHDDEELPESDTPEYTARREQLRALRRGATQEVARVGVRVLDVVAADARDAPSEWRAVACALLDALLGLDVSLTRALLPALDQRGTLHALLADLVQRSALLLRVSDSQQHGERELRVYEATLALLLRLALSDEGARLLLASHVLDALDACAFLAVHPDDAALALDDDDMGDYGARPGARGAIVSTPGAVGTVGAAVRPLSAEQQLRVRLSALLGPVLRLVAQLLATLRHHAEARALCLAWLTRRHELLATLLRDRRAHLSLAGLEQLTQLWQLLRLAAPELLPRYSTPLLQLLTRAALHSERWRTRLQPQTSEEEQLALTPHALSAEASAFTHAVTRATRRLVHVASDACVRLWLATERAPLFAPTLHAAATVVRGVATRSILGEYETLDARALKSPPLTALVLLVHAALDDLALLRSTQLKCAEELSSSSSSTVATVVAPLSTASAASEVSPLQLLAERRRALESLARDSMHDERLAHDVLEQSTALLEGHLTRLLSTTREGEALRKEAKDALSAPGGVLERLREMTRQDDRRDVLLVALTQRLASLA